ncbi:hypothetical protein KAR28_03420 [Candidatus Parcubacteria bacterium]|nr:hypothetical protein [Candidatus Parcubacteria bacterium]
MQVFCFGDSITYGYYDKMGGWTARLRMYVEENYPTKHKIYNLGISGDTTSSILNRMNNEIEVRFNPDKINVLILSCFINDSIWILADNNHLILQNKFKNNLKNILAIAKKYNMIIIALDSLPVVDAKVDPIPWAPEWSYRNKYIRKYQEVLKKVCKEEKVYFIDAYDKLLASSDYMHSLGDGVHPNDIGHKILFEIIKNYLVENEII